MVFWLIEIPPTLQHIYTLVQELGKSLQIM